MKTDVECFPCLLRQALQVARITNCSEKQQIHIVQTVCSLMAEMDVKKSPPANAATIYREIAQITGCEDPYYNKKIENNEQALKIVSCLRQEIRGKDQELSSAVRFAIAGNIIDYGAFEKFDIAAALEHSRTAQLAVDHFAYFTEELNSLKKGSTLLYLADNCGEIVYDSLLIENLYHQGFEIVIAVKDGPIINDALVEDALFAGLDKYGRIITNGCRHPGTELDECSELFLDTFSSADMVIAKGQGNFESLSEVDRPIFFLLTLKCPVAARHMSELNEPCADKLAGKGEMAVYYSGKDKLKGGSNEDTH